MENLKRKITNCDLGTISKWILNSCSEEDDDSGINFLKIWYINSARNGVNGAINLAIVKST